MTVEKNFVDVSPLFNWGKEFQIFDNDLVEVFKVYIRLIGDADLNRARVFALRESANLRKKLRTEDSDERLAYIPDGNYLDTDRLVELILIYSVLDLSKEATKQVQVPYPKEPRSDAPLEEHEKYQELVDSWPKTREEKIKEKLNQLLENKRKTLLELPKDKLIKEFENTIIDNLCETEMLKSFNEMCVYFGTFKDSSYKERLFSSFEDFINLPSEIKNQLQNYYNSLELSTENLKK